MSVFLNETGHHSSMKYPLVQVFPYQSPSDIFAVFSHVPGSILLESAQLRENSGRYSFIALYPFLTLTSKNNEVHLDNQKIPGDCFHLLREYLAQFILNTHVDLPPFQGGAA